MEKKITYNELLKIVHDEIPSYISFLLMVKLDFTENTLYYILSYFFRFLGILILCGNFDITQEGVAKNVVLSNYLRYITTHKLLISLKITNLQYIIISTIILILFCFRMLLYILVIRDISKKRVNISLSKYQIILDHIVFLFYPFILEFLSQIYYSYIFADIYIFKRDLNKYINILFTIINSLLIICYNCNNYFYFHVINRPLSKRNVPVRYRYTKVKFWILLLLQNIIIIQCLDFYFIDDKSLMIYKVISSLFFSLLFLCLFFTSLSSFNYNAITNKFLTIMANFCFFSVITEAISRLFGYTVRDTLTFIMFNVVKIITSLIFEYLSKKLSDSVLFRV